MSIKETIQDAVDAAAARRAAARVASMAVTQEIMMLNKLLKPQELPQHAKHNKLPQMLLLLHQKQQQQFKHVREKQ